MAVFILLIWAVVLHLDIVQIIMFVGWLSWKDPRVHPLIHHADIHVLFVLGHFTVPPSGDLSPLLIDIGDVLFLIGPNLLL